MSIFDSIKDLLGGGVEDLTGGLADIPVVGDISEQLGGVAEEGQAQVEDITNNLGL